MSKRKLTDKQSLNISKRQEASATRISNTIKQISETHQLGAEQSGLVISRFGKQADVETTSGTQAGSITRCYLRANLKSVVTGDRVVWCEDNNQQGVVAAVLPRRSEITRTDSRGISRTLAANIDQMIIVIAPIPPAHQNLIDRYLIAAEATNIKPIILLNKSDLLLTDEKEHEKINKLLMMYKKIGYPTLSVSTHGKTGISTLASHLKNNVSIFVGQSGVGKSSLINTLLPNLQLVVGELSLGTDKGTHTTTASRLFHIPSGGELIDSPGIREFHLTHIDKEQLIHYFVDIRSFLGQCKFRSCQHDQEPGCAIQQAIIDGKIHPSRMESYQRIYTSLYDN